MTAPLLPSPSRDDDHLRLLAIFHYVAAALSCLGIGFLVLHFVIMHSVFSHPELWQKQNIRMPFTPDQLLILMKVLYVCVGLFMIVSGTMNVLSAVFLGQRRHRMFSMVIAALNCLHIPFGTALGVFTLVVLSRDSVRDSYEAQRKGL